MAWVLWIEDRIVSLLLTGWLRLRLVDDIDDAVFVLQRLRHLPRIVLLTFLSWLEIESESEIVGR